MLQKDTVKQTSNYVPDMLLVATVKSKRVIRRLDIPWCSVLLIAMSKHGSLVKEISCKTRQVIQHTGNDIGCLKINYRTPCTICTATEIGDEHIFMATRT